MSSSCGGIPWAEEQFAQQMVQFGRPSVVGVRLPEILLQAIQSYRTMSAQERLSHRASKLGYWLKVMKDLRPQELDLKNAMHPDVALILKSKNICVWEATLKSVNYPDMGVVDEFKGGSDLVGCVDKTGLWPQKFQPALISESELANIAAMERGAIRQQFERTDDDELASEVWNKTLDEVKSGYFEGPINLDDIPRDYPLSRRFGVRQGPKMHRRLLEILCEQLCPGL